MSTVSSMINPFDAEEEKLVCLASGFVVQEDVADKLLEAEKHGEEQFVKFARDNLLSTEPNIFAKLTRNNVVGLLSNKRMLVNDSKGKQINLMLNRDLFARLLLIAKTREVDIEVVLSYSLGTHPLSLATTSGSLLKTAKSKLFEILEGLFSYVTTVIIP